jgi:hypothetical protein
MVAAALSIPTSLAAQDATAPAKKPKHHHYKLIALGTLGGPRGYSPVNAPGYQIININNAGTVAFGADTLMRDPNAPNLCYTSDCFVSHAVRWHNGVLY